MATCTTPGSAAPSRAPSFRWVHCVSPGPGVGGGVGGASPAHPPCFSMSTSHIPSTTTPPLLHPTFTDKLSPPCTPLCAPFAADPRGIRGALCRDRPPLGAAAAAAAPRARRLPAQLLRCRVPVQGRPLLWCLANPAPGALKLLLALPEQPPERSALTWPAPPVLAPDLLGSQTCEGGYGLLGPPSPSWRPMHHRLRRPHPTPGPAAFQVVSHLAHITTDSSLWKALTYMGNSW